jgi:hypothetical protein
VASPIDVLLLLALPASGKSEVRRYLDHLDSAAALRDMALGPTAQLDDYPYVHLMRRVSQELRALGEDPVFFATEESPWRDPTDWLTLIHLLNEDYSVMMANGGERQTPSNLLDRIDRARVLAGATAPFEALGKSIREVVELQIAEDVADVQPIQKAEQGSTIVIEFARGGPQGADLPLPYPLGYASSIAALSNEIRSRCSILYVWVEPKESRRRNRDRAQPGRDGDASILHHGVPEEVMLHDYGTDDMAWLEAEARVPATIPIGSIDIPIQRFDNRTDRTSFLRTEPESWPVEAVQILHHDLSAALGNLAVRQ